MWSVVECAREGGAPCARGKHSATLLGGFIYVLGGRGAGGSLPLRDFWRYSLESGVWERLVCGGEAPPSLQEHSATAHGTRLYVFGGEAGALTETPLWIYDTQSKYWRKLAGQPSYPSAVRRREGRSAGGGAPRGRRGHSAHALRDCLLIYGGYMDLRGSTNELWAFHYESESWQQVRTASRGPARHRHAAALHDARLYVHGGACDLRTAADMWTYDTISRVWSQVRTPAKLSPSGRSGHAAVRAGAHLYIFGGEANGQPTNDMWRFHFATETWERICPTLKWPAPRVDACALLVSGAAGGAPVTAPGAGGADGGPRGGAESGGGGILREISRLSSFHVRRAARCSYSVLGERDSTESLALPKSRSAYGVRGHSPPEGDVVEWRELAREPASVPDLAATGPRAPDSEGEESGTSGYASLAGFTNPHYMGPEVRAHTHDIELRDLRAPAPAPALRLLVVGGREAPHVARLQAPLSMWSYRLL